MSDAEAVRPADSLVPSAIERFTEEDSVPVTVSLVPYEDVSVLELPEVAVELLPSAVEAVALSVMPVP